MDRVTEDNTIGAILFGGLIASILYGVTSMQTITYYQKKCDDKWFIKIAVPLLWALGTIDLGLIFHFLYHYLILNYGNFDSVTQKLPVQTLNGHFFVVAITQSTVRSLCAIRIRALSRSWIPVLPIYIITLVDFGSNIALTIKGAHEQSAGIGHISAAFRALVCTNFAASTAGDVLVALSLLYLLQRGRTGLRSTESMINTIVAYVVSTGLLTTMVQTSALILFLISSQNWIYLAVLTQVSKLYVNAYLALLNDRARIRDQSTLNRAHVSPSRLPTTVLLSNLSFAPDPTSAPDRISQTTLAQEASVADKKVSISDSDAQL